MKLPTLEECNPGIRATGFCVLVALPPKETVTAGGIIIPESAGERQHIAKCEGLVVSMSPAAFDFADFKGEHAEVGDAIMFPKHAGMIVEGKDGKEYRLIQDREIWGIVEENPNG